jgi:arylsulfatase A-like enzyme
MARGRVIAGALLLLAAAAGVGFWWANVDDEDGHRRRRRHRAAETTESPEEEPALDEATRRIGGLLPIVNRADGTAPPNVIFIVWDTVRADRLSFYGYDKPTTPEMAKWAARGVVYEQAVSAGVWTLPSHASLFTGIPVRSHGVGADHKWLDDTHTTIAELLHDIGFQTYAFSANPYMGNDTNLLQGIGDIDHPWTKRWRPSAKETLAGKLIERDHSTSVSPGLRGTPDGKGGNKYLFKEAAGLGRSAFAEFLDTRREEGRPFFAFFNFMEAHLPRVPNEADRKALMDPALLERGLQVLQTSEAFHEHMAGVRDYSTEDYAAISGVYDASLRELDTQTAAMLQDLEDRGLLANTIVVLTSDHGESLGERGLLLHKYSVYNNLSRVPLVVWAPGQAGGRVPDAFSVADVMDLVIDRGQIPVPTEIRDGIAQRRNGRAPGVVTEFTDIADGALEKITAVHPELDLKRFYRTFESIEMEGWKYILDSDGGCELFDMGTDRAETQDRCGEDATRATAMRAALEAWRASVPLYDRSTSQAPRRLVDAEDMSEALKALGYAD